MRAILRTLSLLLTIGLAVAAGPAVEATGAGDLHGGHVEQGDCDGTSAAHDASMHCIKAPGSSLPPWAHDLNLIRDLPRKAVWVFDRDRPVIAFRAEAATPPPRTR